VPCQEKQYIMHVLMLSMQAAYFLMNTTRYTVESMLSAEVVLAMRKSILSAQAGLDLLVVNITTWAPLPGLLILAASLALVIKVGHALITYNLQVAAHIHTKWAPSLPGTCIFFTAGKIWLNSAWHHVS